MDCAIVAFDLSGDALLDGDALAYRQGVTVLYGANGAGKSRLLRGLNAAVTGVRADANVSLIVRAQRSSEWFVGDEDSQFWDSSYKRSRPLSIALAQSMFEQHDESFLAQGRLDLDLLIELDAVDAVIDEFVCGRAGDEDPELLSELLSSRLFLLAPTGTPNAPCWDAFPVADSSLPAARRQLEHFVDLERQLHEASDAAGDAGDTDLEERLLDDYVEGLNDFALKVEGEGWFPLRSGTRFHAGRFQPYELRFNNTFSTLGHELVGPIDFGLDYLDLEQDAEMVTREYLAKLSSMLLTANRNPPGEGDDEFYDLDTIPAHIVAVSSRSQESDFSHDASTEDRRQLSMHVEEAVGRVAASLSAHVSAVLSDVLLDAPVADLQIASPVFRFAHPSTLWGFRRRNQGNYGDSPDHSSSLPSVGLVDLSRAEKSWANKAILEAIYWHERDTLVKPANSLRPVLYLLDEPESALHRAAESHMAHNVLGRGADQRSALVVATHSPEFLDAPESHLIDVKRAGSALGKSLVQTLKISDKEALSSLGLLPSDLLRWSRVILLVEGEQDEVVLDALLGARLREARVQILPVHGATQLPATIDSRVLFDFTRAHLVGLVDNQRADTLIETWSVAQEQALQGETSQAVDTVTAGIGKREAEAKFMSNWLTAGIKKGVARRITPYGLELADVIEYLPVRELVRGRLSWEELRSEHEARRTKSPNRVESDFKEWLRGAYSAEFSPSALRNAALGIPLPQEFDRLMKTIEALSAEVASN